MFLGSMSNAYDAAAAAAVVADAASAYASDAGVVVAASAFASDVVAVGYIHHPMNYSRLDFD